MLSKTTKIKQRFDELTNFISDLKIIEDQTLWKKYIKERNSIEDIALAHEKYESLEREISNIQTVLVSEKDVDLKKMFEEELYNLEKTKESLEEEIKLLLLPKDINSDKNVIIEIRGGAGGEEAMLFGAVLYNMYTRYAERRKWKVEVLELSETDIGGFKEVVFIIKGRGAFNRLKFESGVHRVQRVPETESQGRIHTSTATVAVLPEVEEVDFEILDKDLRIDTYRSSGAGGQHVNKTDSAIRITHIPTGIVVACQDERSQTKNKERAFQILRSKLYDHYKIQADKEYAQTRKLQVGTGDRSERIRTYNYPQGRITDHRINFNLYNIDEFLDGDIDELIEELLRFDQKLKLESFEN